MTEFIKTDTYTCKGKFDGILASGNPDIMSNGSPYFYNLFPRDTSINGAYGLDDITVGTLSGLSMFAPIKTWLWTSENPKTEKLIILCGSTALKGQIWLLNLLDATYSNTGIKASPDTSVQGYPYFDTYTENYILVDGGDLIYFTPTSVEKMTALPTIDHAYHDKTHVFLGLTEVYLTTSPTPSDLKDSATTIKLPTKLGQAISLFTLHDTLFVLMTEGIAKVEVGRQEVEKAFTFFGITQKNTAKIVRGDLYFMTTAGFIKFDGYDGVRVLREVFPLIDLTSPVECFSAADKYFISCTVLGEIEGILDRTKHDKQDGFVVYSPREKYIDIFRGATFHQIFPSSLTSSPKVALSLVSYQNHSYRIMTLSESRYPHIGDQYIKGTYLTPNVHVLTSGTHILRRIFVKSTADVTLTVSTDTAEISFKIKGSMQERELIVNLPYNRFCIRLDVTAGEVLIFPIKYEMETIKKYNAEQRRSQI